MLKKDQFQWTDIAEQSFQTLKKGMTFTPVLALPHFTKPFVIECDVLGTGIGAVLMQEGRPLAFFSKALHGWDRARYGKEDDCNFTSCHQVEAILSR